MKTKRFAASALCLVLLFSQAFPAFAQEDAEGEEDIFCPFEQTEEAPAQEDFLQDSQLTEETAGEDEYEEDEVSKNENGEASEDPAEDDEDRDPAIEDAPQTEDSENEFDEIKSGVCGAELTWKLLDTGTLIIDGKGEMYNGRLILDKTFSWSDYRKDVTSIKIMPGVTSVGDYAFNNFENLTSVSLPSTIISIGEGAFRKCETLPSIEIPKSTLSIGSSAFYGCSGLAAVSLPAGLNDIGIEAFRNCSKLKEIAIPVGVKEIKSNTFEGCSVLESISLPAGVTVIGDSAFASCAKLGSINLPAGIKKISSGCFSGCKSLTGLIIPKGVESIENLAFAACTALGSLEIPASVKSIGSYAFSGSGIKTIRFKGDAPQIGQSAFLGVTAKAYYPGNNSTWTKEIMQDYGGKISWEAYILTHDAPVLQTPANHENFMIIQWSKVEDATGYRLQYREGNGAWTEVKVALTQVNSKGEPRWDYRDAKDGATYTFRVFADFADGTSTESNRMGQMRLRTPKITVSRFGGSILSGGFRVDWEETTGGSQYKIYYREQGGSWALYTMIPKSYNVLFTNIKASVTNANSDMPNLLPGRTYEFMVLTCTSQACVTSGYPTPFVSMKF